MDNSKTCTKCRQIKPLEAFGKMAKAKDGLQTRCKICVNIYNKNYYLINAEKIKPLAKQHSKRRYAEMPDICNATSARWAKANRDKRKIIQKRYDLANPHIIANKVNKRRANKLNNGVFIVLSKELKRLYASCCIYCGSREGIEADHVIPVSRGGRHSIGNLVPACRLCNRSKHNKTVMEWKKWKRNYEL